MGFRFAKWLLPLLVLPTLLIASDTANILGWRQTLFCGQYEYYQTDYFWNCNGQTVKSFNNFKRDRFDLYLAYGLTSNDTLELQGAYNHIEESANGNTNGFDDVQLSWKHYFGIKHGHYVTGRAMAIIPVGPRKLNLRYGRWGTQFDLFVCKDFCLNRHHLWYDLGAGYRWYSGYPSDQVRGYFQAGWTPFRRFSIVADGLLKYGVYNGHQTDPQNLILYNANYRLFKGSIYAVVQLHRCAYLYFGGFRHLWGRNVGTGGGFFAGSYITF